MIFCWLVIKNICYLLFRNISSDGEYARKNLRQEPGLVDSIFYIIKGELIIFSIYTTTITTYMNTVTNPNKSTYNQHMSNYSVTSINQSFSYSYLAGALLVYLAIIITMLILHLFMTHWPLLVPRNHFLNTVSLILKSSI